MNNFFGYDFPLVDKPNISGINILGMEANETLFSSGVKEGTTYFLSGLTADLMRKLKNGEAALEFWIEAIDHNTPTANNKLYPADVFQRGLESPAFQRQLNLGGVGGEAEHPMIVMHSENGDSQMNIYNNLARVCRIDPNNISHYVVGYKCTPDKTYFKIRTNPGNPVIFNAILAGRKPGFSIRTRGDFEARQDGVVVATSLEVIGIDWVANPANASSVIIGTGMNIIDQLNPKEEVQLNLLPKISNESVAMESFMDKDDVLLYDPDLNPLEQISAMKIVKKGTPKKKLSFESEFMKECLSFLE